MNYLYVWATGAVEQGLQLPEGAIMLDKSNRKRDFEKHLAACRLMYDGTHSIGAVHDAVQPVKSPLSLHPEETPEQALHHWMKWRKIGPYRE